MQVKKESRQNQSRWWIWSRDAAQEILTCLPLLQQKAPGKTRCESQIPLSSWNEQQPRTGRPVMGACSSDCSEWTIDEKWSSQEWKSGEMLEARTERPVGGQQFTQHTDKFVIDDDDMDSDTITESDLSYKNTVILAQGEWSIAKDVGLFSRRCNERHRQTFFNLENVYVFHIGSICFHGKELLRQFTFHQKYREHSHNETDVWHTWKVDSRTIR